MFFAFPLPHLFPVACTVSSDSSDKASRRLVNIPRILIAFFLPLSWPSCILVLTLQIVIDIYPFSTWTSRCTDTLSHSSLHPQLNFDSGTSRQLAVGHQAVRCLVLLCFPALNVSPCVFTFARSSTHFDSPHLMLPHLMIVHKTVIFLFSLRHRVSLNALTFHRLYRATSFSDFLLLCSHLFTSARSPIHFYGPHLM